MPLLFDGAAFWPDPATGLAAGAAKMYVYLAGSTTPVDTFQDVDLNTLHTYPVVAASSGVFASVYVAADYSYRAIIKTTGDVTIADIDDIAPGAAYSIEASSISAMAALDSLFVGATVSVLTGYNDDREDFDIVASGTYVANGTTVVTLTGISGQAISKRRKFNTLVELLADTRTAAAFAATPASDAEGTIFEVPGVGTYEMALTGATDNHLATAGPTKLYLRRDSDTVHVDALGAVGDGTTVDTAAIQAALDLVAADGGGIVMFGAKRYVINATLEQEQLVIIDGQGLASELYLKSSSNCDMIRTRGFATFNGTNSWNVTSTGIPYGYGVRNIKLNGNGAGNTSGKGYVGFGKIRFFTNVLVVETAERGVWHQCGNTIGQTDFKDLPEALWDFEVYECGNVGTGDHGCVMAGPHDGHYQRIVAVSSGTTSAHWGVYIYGDSFVTGGGRVGRIHTYGGSGSGVKISGSNATLQGEHVIAENGMLIETPGSSIAIVQNGSANYGKAIHLTAGGNQIGLARVGTNDVSHDAIVIESSGNIISNIRCFAESAGTGVSLDIDGGNNQIGQAYLDGQGGTGGRAIRMGNSAGVDNNTVLSAYITGAEKSFEYANAGVRNNVSIISSNATAANHFIGDAPAVTDSFKVVSLGSSYDLPPVTLFDASTTGNVGTGSTSLTVLSIPAGSFFRTGVRAKIKAWGATANNANAKTITLEFGSGNTILSKALTTGIAGSWYLEANVIASGTNTQGHVAMVLDGDAGVQDVEVGTSTETTTAAISVRCRGTATTNNDITQTGMIIEWVH